MSGGITLDEAIEDYLNGVVRVRPWTKKREEELLHPFCDWVYAQPGADCGLAAVTPELAARYAAEAGLDDARAEELRGVLRTVLLWAREQGVLAESPFA